MSTNGVDRCEELQPQLAAYALGEAEPDPELLTHLARCADCWRTLHSYAQIALTLPYTAPQVTPAPELRARILAAATAPTVPVVEQPRQQPKRWTWPWIQINQVPRLAFALVLLVALLGWNVALQLRLNRQAAQLDRLTTQVEASRSNWRTMTQVLNSSDVQDFALSGNEGSGRFWTSPRSNVACLVVENIPDPGPGNVYQVWLIQGDSRVAIGSFVPQAGSGWVLLRIDQPLIEYQAVGITVEPRGGSAAPSGQDVLKGSITVSARLPGSSNIETLTFTPYDSMID